MFNAPVCSVGTSVNLFINLKNIHLFVSQLVYLQNKNTQGFLTVITLQIDATIGWSNLEFILFWPIFDSNTLLLVIKSWTDILDITLEVPEEIIGGAAVVKFQNKV